MSTPRSRTLFTVVMSALLTTATLYAQTPVGTAFTYQGQLKDGGLPAEGNYDLRFRLYDDPNAGAQVGSDTYADDWLVSGGLFNVELDFGAVFAGDALWLEVAVRPWDSVDPHTVLSPRQPLTASPYALYALNSPGSSGLWTESGDDIYYDVGNVGIGMTKPLCPLQVESTALYTVHARNRTTSGTSYGGFFRSDSYSGYGVIGYASDATGGNVGVFGKTDSVNANAYGVYGRALATTGQGRGVYGQTESTEGTGVHGEAVAATGTNFGVKGTVASPDGYAGYFTGGRNYFEGNVGIGTTDPEQLLHLQHSEAGVAPNADSLLVVERNGSSYINILAPDSAESGVLFGNPTDGSAAGGVLYNSAATPAGMQFSVAGNSTEMVIQSDGNVGVGTTAPGHTLHVVSDGERAIFGENTAASGPVYGVYGQSACAGGHGVRGVATAVSGAAYGVYGQSDSTSGRGVYGTASATSGTASGVFGQTWASDGRGVCGLARDLSGVNYGVYGNTHSPNGFAGYFVGGSNYFQGDVGIGTDAPAAKLHISGTPDVDGIMFPDGTLQTTAATAGGPAGGDLSGTYPDPSVVGLQGQSVRSATPQDGDVLAWSGWDWTPLADGLALPYTGSTSSSDRAFRVINNGSGDAIVGHTNGSSAYGVHGSAGATTGYNYGVYGEIVSTDGGAGVYGLASGSTGNTFGVIGKSDSATGGAAGVLGEATATTGNTSGVVGTSASDSGIGVRGAASATSGFTYGLSGRVDSPNGKAVYGEAVSVSGSNYGVYGETASNGGTAVRGHATASSGTTTGVSGESSSAYGWGVVGTASATTGDNIGVAGFADGDGGIGVRAAATATAGGTYGLKALVYSPAGTAVYGEASATTGAADAIYGVTESPAGKAVRGEANSTSGSATGVFGLSSSVDGMGVHGSNDAPSGISVGVAGSAVSPSGYGVQCSGDLRVFGDLTVTGSKAGYVTDIVLNGGDEDLECGDVVDIIGAAEPIMGDIPVIVVRLSRSRESRAALGPVDCALMLTEVRDNERSPIARLQYESRQFHVHHREGVIGPGEYGRVVTLGAFKAIKVDADRTPVRPGDLLVSSSTPGFAASVAETESIKPGTVIGKALAAVETGWATIPVLVQPR